MIMATFWPEALLNSGEDGESLADLLHGDDLPLLESRSYLLCWKWVLGGCCLQERDAPSPVSWGGLMLFSRSSESGLGLSVGQAQSGQKGWGVPQPEPLRNGICLCLGTGVPQQPKVPSLRRGKHSEWACHTSRGIPHLGVTRTGQV